MGPGRGLRTTEPPARSYGGRTMDTHQVASETGESTDTELLETVDRDGAIPLESLGEGELYIDVDGETYRRLRAVYEDLVGHGYTEPFDTFALNHLRTGGAYVTVDGHPIDPTTPLEDSEEVVDLATVNGEREVSDR